MFIFIIKENFEIIFQNYPRENYFQDLALLNIVVFLFFYDDKYVYFFQLLFSFYIYILLKIKCKRGLRKYNLY